MLLNELTLFIRFHFMAEENLMMDAGYDNHNNLSIRLFGSKTISGTNRTVRT